MLSDGPIYDAISTGVYDSELVNKLELSVFLLTCTFVEILALLDLVNISRVDGKYLQSIIPVVE
jgi:hypothetical protein